MPFNSLKYFLFLPIVYLVFYFVRDRARWCVLLAASLLFYASLNLPYLLVVLILTTMTTYGFGIWIYQTNRPNAKFTLLWSGIAINVLILVVMKYLPFLSENLKVLLTFFSFDINVPAINVIAAIGVSFYIFQALSYLFDIYLEKEKPERHFGYFALYLAFFPKLVQGPIERSADLIPQLKTRYEFNYNNMRSGMLQFIWGLFKKVVIADRLGIFTNTVYDNVHSYQGLSLLIATYFYAFQIYMDFSGYTDMALGSARMFNINLSRNFNSPYLATSVIDFWRRWHISFSRWILDYIFKPLQMQWRDWKSWGTAGALVITFLISGIWHGASWGFVIWGGLHGLFMACAVFYKPYQQKLHKALGIEKGRLLKTIQIVATFHLVCFSWIFFRAKDLNSAWYIVTHIFNLKAAFANYETFSSFLVRNIFMDQTREFFIVLLSFILTATVSIVVNRTKNNSFSDFLEKRSLPVRWGLYIALTCSIIVFAVYESSTFIYYQF
jgi:alginate O-acetyltransferase complex protein AlgI